MVRRGIDTRLPCKDGPPGLFHWAARRVSVDCTGRCEPRRAFLAIRRGKQSREARCEDPPSSGLLRFWCQTPLGSAAGGLTGVRRRASSGPARPPDRCQTPGYDELMVRKVLLASPRGYCAGVERAVDTVEKALELYGPPVYVRKQIVHNLHVVRDLEARGAVFVDEETEVPEGETVVFSAHGVAPSVYANAQARQLNT